MRNGCLITKATDTHSEYVILFAFPLQQWLHERVSVLCSTFIACIVGLYKNDFLYSDCMSQDVRLG